jgi:hypothetical protein
MGQRGAGKTVFLASHALGQQWDGLGDRRGAWICKDPDTQAILGKIRDFIAKTGSYPPATLKIANFDLTWISAETGATWADLCWWDLPGETCQLYNPAFLSLITQASGILLFLDGEQMVEMADNVETIACTWSTELGILEILHLNRLAIPVALVVTKGDRLAGNTVNWQRLHRGIEHLRHKLGTLELNTHLFISQIPIVCEQGHFRLQPAMADSPLSWLADRALKVALSAAVKIERADQEAVS